MKVLFEDDRLIFQPDTERDRGDLAQWWAQLQRLEDLGEKPTVRGLHGVYHHASRKHLHRYVDEFTWRLNEGNAGRHTTLRLDSFVDAVAGKRLTYKRLIR